MNSGLCIQCDASLAGKRRDAKFCSPGCARVGQAPGCATSGCERPKRAKGFCGPCYNRSRRSSGLDVQPWNDRRRDNYHRRKAIKKGASTGRPVRLAEIRDRDRNRCHLCNLLVPSKAWPHPLSPSLDHVVPLIRGGAHDPDNVRLAHLRCNTEKGANGGNEQLLLIG